MDPDEGLRNAPLHNCTVGTLGDLIERLAARSADEGRHYRVRLVLEGAGDDFAAPYEAIGFMLWIPARFLELSASSGPWPTVFSLHGRGETVGRNQFDRLASVVRHGLQHRMPDRSPFNSRFVLITPQMQSARNNLTTADLEAGVAAPFWMEHVPALELLRQALFGASSHLDRSRAYLTGVSVGGTGVWAWAGFNTSPVQPWAAIVASSASWPWELNVNDTRPFPLIEASSLHRLATIPGIYVIHCANDGSMPIYVGAAMRPKCILQYFGVFDRRTTRRYGPPMCAPGADAIVEALQHVSAPVTYERLDFCPMVHQPSDSHFTAMYEASTTDLGHDSAQRLYAQARFGDWLLTHRLPDAQRWW